MKETVKPTVVLEKTGKSGKSYFSVELADGRKGNSFDDLRPYLNKDIELDVVQKGQFLNFYLPKEEKKTDSEFDVKLRSSALESATIAAKVGGQVPSVDNIIATANRFVEYIKTGK